MMSLKSSSQMKMKLFMKPPEKENLAPHLTEGDAREEDSINSNLDGFIP